VHSLTCALAGGGPGGGGGGGVDADDAAISVPGEAGGKLGGGGFGFGFVAAAPSRCEGAIPLGTGGRCGADDGAPGGGGGLAVPLLDGESGAVGEPGGGGGLGLPLLANIVDARPALLTILLAARKLSDAARTFRF
jgi:hypothetical protein